jgi:hypothetical protein
MGRRPSKLFGPQQRNEAGRVIGGKEMTGDQSRTLKVGDRVCWGATTTDLGTVVGTEWSGVTIDWDDGHRASIQHNDMAKIERAPVKV